MDVKLNKISNALRQNRTFIASAAITALLTAPAFAFQEAEQSGEQATTIEVVSKTGEVEVIEVRGMRGTMTRSLNEKKNTAAIVDAIAAADFGDLPGLSLSDVIENVSGASGHRLKGSQN
jgi:iron complex outermembrane recepter protein